MKLAAIEARWDTARHVPLTLFAWPSQQSARNDYAIEIPALGSLILTHELDGEVKGLKEVPASDRPPVLPVFFAFRIMVGCGMILLLVALAGLMLRWRRKLYDTSWYQYACMASVPLGFIATLAGWVVTEVGRQPYVVYGHMLTSAAVSPIHGGAVASSLAVALVLYNLLLISFFWYGGRLVLRGIDDDTPIAPVTRPAGAVALANAAPTTQA
jgi:cytochrome d ubiquinol oxidase subunit I